MAVNTSTRLGCGRDIDDVWDDIDNPPDAHEQTCPDCTAARESLSGLAQATSLMHTTDGADRELQASPLVLTRILDTARSEIRRGRRLPLSKQRRAGISVDLSVSEQAVAVVVRRACDRNAAIHLRRCAVELVNEGSAEGPGAEWGVDGSGEPEPSEVRLVLRVSVAVSGSIPEITGALRDEVVGAVRREVGMNVLSIEIVVEDVHHV